MELTKQLQEPIERTVEGFVLNISFEENQYIKDRYVREMFYFIRGRGKMREYKIGIEYLSIINEKHLMYELAEDMVFKHPIAGRIARLVYPSLWPSRQEANP